MLTGEAGEVSHWESLSDGTGNHVCESDPTDRSQSDGAVEAVEAGFAQTAHVEDLRYVTERVDSVQDLSLVQLCLRHLFPHEGAHHRVRRVIDQTIEGLGVETETHRVLREDGMPGYGQHSHLVCWRQRVSGRVFWLVRVDITAAERPVRQPESTQTPEQHSGIQIAA